MPSSQHSPCAHPSRFGETFEACAAREVAEECGIQVSDLQVTTVTNVSSPLRCAEHPIAARPPRPAGAPTRWRAQALGLEARYHYVVVFLICETEQEPTNMEPDKCAGAGP